MKGTKKPLKKGRSLVGTIIFYTLYLMFIAAVVFGVYKVLTELTVSLDNYERSLEKYEAEEVFESYYQPCRFDKMFDMQSIELSEFENKNHFVKYMEQQIAGKEITYKEISSGANNTKKYAVAADKVKFSEFVLVKNESPETPEDTWELESITTIGYSMTESVAFKVYSDSKVFVNGTELADSYITADGITTESCNRVPEGVSGITLKEYKVEGLLLPPEFKTVNRHGNESSLLLDEKTGKYVEEITYDTVSDDIKALATDAAQTYAKYITLDASLYNLSQYFDSTSQTYDNIRKSEIRWYTYHVGFEFKDVELKEYYIYDENTFSIRYSSNHYVYRTRNEVHNFPLDLTLYFKNINGRFYVYDMISNY